jgi:hypothetical protein
MVEKGTIIVESKADQIPKFDHSIRTEQVNSVKVLGDFREHRNEIERFWIDVENLKTNLRIVFVTVTNKFLHIQVAETTFENQITSIRWCDVVNVSKHRCGAIDRKFEDVSQNRSNVSRQEPNLQESFPNNGIAEGARVNPSGYEIREGKNFQIVSAKQVFDRAHSTFIDQSWFGELPVHRNFNQVHHPS